MSLLSYRYARGTCLLSSSVATDMGKRIFSLHSSSRSCCMRARSGWATNTSESTMFKSMSGTSHIMSRYWAAAWHTW